MTKKELIAEIAKGTELSQHAVSNVIESITEQVCALLCRGDRITLSGFGTFSTKNRAQREGRNPQTGESMIIPAHRVVKFTVAKKMKEAVNDS
ncbi:MAG: HU family DNA-binding protein [Thermodesulfobacteriota bacterium]|nr:HU family DNA-binding protein [Thermodesulfobacteriota bacterium]